MSNVNPLNLPEVRIVVSRYLARTSLMACALVNKDWHLDFQPSLWEEICVRSDINCTKSPEELQLILHSLQKNLVYTKRLLSQSSYSRDPRSGHIFPITLDVMPNLVSLTVRTSCRDVWKSFWEVIRRSRPTLLYLELLPKGRYINTRYTDREIHDMFEGLSVLRVLTTDIVDKITGLIQVLATCPSLKELYVEVQVGWDQYACYDEGSGERTVDTKGLPSLKSHNLEIFEMYCCNDSDLPDLFAVCPKIKHFKMGCGHLSSFGNAKQLASSPFCDLTSLKLFSSHRQYISIKAILIALPQHQLRDVKLEGAIDEDIQQLVDSHHKSLVVVSIVFIKTTSTGGSKGHSLSSIFSCPLLETITYEDNVAIDVRLITQEPWNCPSLKDIDMPLALDRSGTNPKLTNLQLEEKEEVAPGRDECDQAEIMFMRQLGKMTQLRNFVYTGYMYKENIPTTLFLSWRLSHGVGHLANLAQLERLDFGLGSTSPGVDELEFMRDHWLRCWRMRSYSSYSYSEEMQDWMQQHWSNVLLTRRNR